MGVPYYGHNVIRFENPILIVTAPTLPLLPEEFFFFFFDLGFGFGLLVLGYLVCESGLGPWDEHLGFTGEQGNRRGLGFRDLYGLL